MSTLDQLVKPYDDGSFSELQEQAAAELATLRAVVEAARDVVLAVDGFGSVGSLYDKRNVLAAALAAYDKK